MIRPVRRFEGVAKDVVGYLPALRDRCGFIKGPVNAEIYPALSVFLLRLRKRGEMSRLEWTNVPLIVQGRAIKFIGDKCESDVVAAIEISQCLKDGATKSSVSGRIRRKGWGEVWSGKIVGRSAERHECRIPRRARIPIA